MFRRAMGLPAHMASRDPGITQEGTIGHGQAQRARDAKSFRPILDPYATTHRRPPTVMTMQPPQPPLTGQPHQPRDPWYIPLERYTRRAPVPLPRSAYSFPSAAHSRRDTLIASGGDFSPETIVEAYRAAAFPWPNDAEEYLWFSPNPRAILPIGGLHVSRSLARTIRSGRFRVTVDRAFEDVIAGCAHRPGEDTWITPALRRGYLRLHELGWAHSFETWEGERLVGGLYGLGVGAMFGAESMFHRVSDASKVAMAAMMQHAIAIGIQLIDIQVLTPHTHRMGGVLIPRIEYVRRLKLALAREAQWFVPADETPPHDGPAAP